MLKLMSGDKGLEQKPLQPVAAEVLAGEEVALRSHFVSARSGCWSQMAPGFLPFQGPPSGFSGGSPLATVSGRMDTALVTTQSGNK